MRGAAGRYTVNITVYLVICPYSIILFIPYQLGRDIFTSAPTFFALFAVYPNSQEC